MKQLDLGEVREYINENIVDFHRRRVRSLEKLKLGGLLKKNPYLFRAKNITKASDLCVAFPSMRFSRRVMSLSGPIAI